MWLVDIPLDRSTLSRLTQLHCLYSLCHPNRLMERKPWARTLISREKLRRAGTGGRGCRREEVVLGSDSTDRLRLTFLKTSWSHDFNLHLSKGMRQSSFLSVQNPQAYFAALEEEQQIAREKVTASNSENTIAPQLQSLWMFLCYCSWVWSWHGAANFQPSWEISGTVSNASFHLEQRHQFMVNENNFCKGS